MITGAGITADRLSECLMAAELLFRQKYCKNCFPFSTDLTVEQGGTSCGQNTKIKISASGMVMLHIP